MVFSPENFRKKSKKKLTNHIQISKLISNGYGIEVQDAKRGDKARHGIIGENDDLIVFVFVSHEKAALLRVTHENAWSHSLYLQNKIWYLLVLALAQQLFFTQIIDAQQVAHADKYTALERAYRAGDVFDGRLVQQL